MAVFETATVRNGTLVLPRPLTFPEGAEVRVRIEPPDATDPDAVGGTSDDYRALPFFGLWRDRDDMRDSTAWVRTERERWQQRRTRQD